MPMKPRTRPLDNTDGVTCDPIGRNLELEEIVLAAIYAHTVVILENPLRLSAY